MKKIVFGLLALVFAATTSNSFAQLDNQENNVKNFRFGLQIDPTIGWLSIDDKKKFESDGTVIGFGWGAAMEFRLNDITSIKTGIRISYDGGRVNFLSSAASGADSTYYVLNNRDQAFVTPDTAALNSANNTSYLLEKRRYKINYVNIPVLVKMKTKEIGYMTYFGQFGANIGVRTRARVDDDVKALPQATATSLTDLDLGNGAQPLRLGITIGGGAEYNFSGSTSLVFGLSYDHFFTNALKKEDDYLRRVDTDGVTLLPIEQNARFGNIRLSVGILF